ncbi:Alpha/Beta hydrolase protein [Aspergillus pseudonomiae]|uniref:Alpha/Beta hydrolase protein n=1 Tax=Aspergillus pseudonomiae TaxID=1506151 RepID=A0A5N7DH47_9EURO|nr:Alpha/Beta hydrolase protein [Aspergillus pseudonomiae]KAB8255844.1 Alpha/Beta hydrolase protein [Aspergillus pseudonomiae]KAE8405353.1 Alpha/Beta hydrolase protein [Aspergillus pseudonomiae]
MPTTPFFDLLNALDSINNAEKYSAFHTVNATYKTSRDENSHITADILIPRTLRDTQYQGPRPVIVRIHGGFLVTGSSLYPPWFSNWILGYALINNAIIISPNYRLLPEVTGRDILDDMNDFWHWLHSGSVDPIIWGAGYQGVTLDQDSLLVVGESAGGYLAIQLAITYPSEIRGVVAAYPMVDLRSKFYTETYSKPIVGVPNVPVSLLDDHLAMMATRKQGRIEWVTAADPPDRLELAFSMVQNGKFLDFFGSKDRGLFPMERLQDRILAGERVQLPPMFIFHGQQDSAVPVDSSKAFVRFLREKVPHARVMFYTQDGDHGFDVDATLETPWLKDGLQRISKVWLESCSSNL